ncbi:PREDICTED: kinesin-like protein KIN-14G isoform X2 [Tarenaya hassleriana]|uniref:kinesin-like protein KIN-14G isoform X2 n=1 Tax=Tarenaya hassleriana TaxID=28532 RepID=UPI00053C7FD5|nr:PREDICTED: kinesin-like protein KIN-14G isoform X2 [Tarenaya hassleriana]
MTSLRTGLHDFNMTSRRAEEAAMRRFQAVEWLHSTVGPLGISSQPSEKEFISCLRNGLILCNAINKIHPGAVSKVVENYSHMPSFSREYQPPAAYQYFENVRNFLVALENLKLPAFEASDLDKDNLESGSVAKVVDCILGLKAYQEWKLTSNGNGSYKHIKTPTAQYSATKILSTSSKHLDRSSVRDKTGFTDSKSNKLEDVIAKLLVDEIADSKENMDENLTSGVIGSENSRKAFKKIITSFVSDKLEREFPELHSVFKDFLKEGNCKPSELKSMPLGELPFHDKYRCCRSCPQKGKCNHKRLLKLQEKELVDLKSLISETKQDLENFQLHLQKDLRELGNWVEEMSSAAFGYQKVVKENQKLYNMVQDLKGSIRVYCRVRPIFNSDWKGVVDFIGEDGSLVVLDPSKTQKDARKMFRFNQVFGPSATQDDVFKETQPLIRSVIDGYNVCIFAYGQTGSGKTYTMSGPPGRSATEMGINYLALSDLFLISDKRRDIMTYEIYVQMVEIYNEQVRDLLAENSSSTRLEIRSCSNEDGLSLPDATMHSVKSTMDVIRLMEAGEVNRTVSSTSMNNRSSRSHSILTVHVRGKDTSGGTLRSCLHLVDLAGSERVDKSEVTGDRLKEAQYINKSLACLGDVISALAQKNSHIPYRNSKLTLLLQESLGGQAKTLMFAHLSPEEDSFSETISTLKFAQRVSTVELGAARAHKETREVVQLKEQIENLKKTLASKEEGYNTAYRIKEVKSPSGKPVATMERTPPRLRILSIENCSITKTERRNLEERKGPKTPTMPNRSRRSSLEGPKSFRKENVPVKKQIPDAEELPQCYGYVSNVDPRSPAGSCQKRVAKIDGRTSIPQIQLPKTPDQRASRNEIQIVMHSELTFSADSRANGKGSQIRKSLRNIGKLINGSEKRKENNNSVEPRSPLRVANNSGDGKSPITSNGRMLRRRSLTGVMPSEGTERSSRRSSLGGKPIQNGVNDARNAKTPPPMHPSSSMAEKRWL